MKKIANRFIKLDYDWLIDEKVMELAEQEGISGLDLLWFRGQSLDEKSTMIIRLQEQSLLSFSSFMQNARKSMQKE